MYGEQEGKGELKDLMLGVWSMAERVNSYCKHKRRCQAGSLELRVRYKETTVQCD